MKKTLILTSFVAALSGSAGVWISSHATKSEQGSAYPLAGVSFKNINGEAIQLSSFQGRTIVLNFWATWCPPCVKEMPELDALYPELQKKNIELLGIGIDSPSNMREFLTKQNIRYPLLVAGVGGTELASALGNQGGALPFTVIIDKNGRIILKKLGQISADEIRKALK
jgi:peroxiredoxin